MMMVMVMIEKEEEYGERGEEKTITITIMLTTVTVTESLLMPKVVLSIAHFQPNLIQQFYLRSSYYTHFTEKDTQIEKG